MTDYIRVTEAARLLQVTPATIRNMIDRGRFPGARKIDPSLKNSPYRIPRSEIDQALPQENPPVPDQQP